MVNGSPGEPILHTRDYGHPNFSLDNRDWSPQYEHCLVEEAQWEFRNVRQGKKRICARKSWTRRASFSFAKGLRASRSERSPIASSTRLERSTSISATRPKFSE